MADRWIIVENQGEVERAFERYGTASPFLATTAESYAVLESERDAAVTATSAYLPYDEQNQLSLTVSELVGPVTETMSSAFADRTVAIPDDFRPFDAFTFLMKKVLDPLLFRERQLRGFIDTEDPSELVLWRAPEDGKLRGPSTVYSALGRRLFGSTTTRLLSSAQFRTDFDGAMTWHDAVPRADTVNDEAGPTLSERFNTALVDSINRNRFRGFSTFGFDSLALTGSGRDRILMLDVLPPIESFVKRMRDRQPVGIDWWTNQNAAPVSLTTGRTLVSLAEPQPVERMDRQAYREIITPALRDSDNLPTPVSAVFGPIFAQHLRETMPELVSLFETARAYCETYSPSAVLAGATYDSGTKIIAQAAAAADVPIVSFQHGGNYGYNVLEKLRFGDLEVADIFCTLGDGVTRAMEIQTECYNLPTDPVTVGAGRRRDGGANTGSKDTKRPRLLFASTGLSGDMNYGPFYYYDDIEYYRHLTQVVEVLSELDEFDRSVKLHPKDKIRNPLVNQLHSTSDIDVYYQKSFEELLDGADIVLLDYPSTTLLETMLTGIPLVYLDIGWSVWMPEGRERLEACVDVVEKDDPTWKSDLRAAIRRATTRGTGEAYDPFLDAFSRRKYDASRLVKRLFDADQK